MTPSLRFLALLMPSIILGIVAITTPVLNRAIVPSSHDTGDLSLRSSSTCADPSLTRTIFQGFATTIIEHLLSYHEVFVSETTVLNVAIPLYNLQGPVFKAWPQQQPFTSPLFELSTTDGSQFIFRLGADAQTPPIVGGFKSDGIVAWVYDSPVCGSVPLLSATFASKTDHYYTTDSAEHAGFLAQGWTDSGVIAFVLPLS